MSYTLIARGFLYRLQKLANQKAPTLNNVPTPPTNFTIYSLTHLPIAVISTLEETREE